MSESHQQTALLEGFEIQTKCSFSTPCSLIVLSASFRYTWLKSGMSHSLVFSASIKIHNALAAGLQRVTVFHLCGLEKSKQYHSQHHHTQRPCQLSHCCQLYDWSEPVQMSKRTAAAFVRHSTNGRTLHRVFKFPASG